MSLCTPSLFSSALDHSHEYFEVLSQVLDFWPFETIVVGQPSLPKFGWLTFCCRSLIANINVILVISYYPNWSCFNQYRSPSGLGWPSCTPELSNWPLSNLFWLFALSLFYVCLLRLRYSKTIWRFCFDFGCFLFVLQLHLDSAFTNFLK